MIRYKMAVKISHSFKLPVYVGFVGEGNDEDQAKYDAMRQLIAFCDEEAKKSIDAPKWTIINPIDVYTLHSDIVDKLKKEWEDAQDRLDRFGNPWP
jgi:translation initiation factor 2 alpha subunit (eIF-2alpha)